jgi:hypothetical protein
MGIDPTGYCLIAAGIFLCAIVLGLATHNVVKFWQFRNLALGCFYLCTILQVATRIGFFIVYFTTTDASVQMIMLVIPGTFDLAIGISQINIYVQLILRVKAI